MHCESIVSMLRDEGALTTRQIAIELMCSEPRALTALEALAASGEVVKVRARGSKDAQRWQVRTTANAVPKQAQARRPYKRTAYTAPHAPGVALRLSDGRATPSVLWRDAALIRAVRAAGDVGAGTGELLERTGVECSISRLSSVIANLVDWGIFTRSGCRKAYKYHLAEGLKNFSVNQISAAGRIWGPNQIAVICVVAENDGKLTTADVERKIDAARSNVGGVVRLLEKVGVISRPVGKCTLTEDGQRVFELLKILGKTE